ncbi:MAG: phage major capsid protein [Dehalococcoidia bacterium]|nr:phage major capsid protein [Dehalococcoidia bacterium]
MALTLVEAEKLSNDVLLQGVIETVIKDSPILQTLPFIQIQGNGLTYTRESVLPSIAFYDVGDTWAESTPTFTQATATLKIMGGDADVDNYLRSTRSNVQDLETAVIEQKAKALRHTFEEYFIYGNSATSSKQFDGVRKLIDTTATSDQLIAAGASGATLTLAMVDQLVDAVRGGKPDLLLMSRRSRRKIQTLARAAGNNLQVGTGVLGQQVQLYNGIPVGISDWVLDTHTVSSSVETAVTGALCSTIYALRFGEGALCGLSSPEMLQVERVGQLETKDATRHRIKWYTSLALFSSISCAALIGVKD